jgi:hypothetical protein
VESADGLGLRVLRAPPPPCCRSVTSQMRRLKVSAVCRMGFAY